MRRLFTYIALFCCIIISAEERYSLSVLGDYSYNRTYASHGNIEVLSSLPVNPYVELEGKLRLSTANLYTANVTVRPKFPVPVGELFLDVELCYNAIARSRQWDFVTAFSLGYRMDYVSVEVGFFSRVMDVYHREWHSEEAYNVEPFNLLYRLQVNTRPYTENWNLWFALTNKDDFTFERMWAPFFQIGARYDVNEHWRILLDSELKLSGMFHLNAEFYSAYLRAGFSYRF